MVSRGGGAQNIDIAKASSHDLLKIAKKTTADQLTEDVALSHEISDRARRYFQRCIKAQAPPPDSSLLAVLLRITVRFSARMELIERAGDRRLAIDEYLRLCLPEAPAEATMDVPASDDE